MSMTDEIYLETLKGQLKNLSFKAGLCDMLGWRDGAGVITKDSPPHKRYEIRSRQHIEVYKFTVLASNY